MVEKPRHLESRIVSTSFLLAKPEHRPYNKNEVNEMDEKVLLDAISAMMDEKLEPIKRDLADVKQRVTKIETAQEQVTNKKIQLLVEAQTETKAKMEKLDEMAERVEDIQITVNAMEAVTKQNCTDIKQLRAVK